MWNLMHPTALCLAITILLQSAIVVHAQTTDRPKLSTYLDELTRTRNAIKTYQVRMTGTIVNRGRETTVPGQAIDSVASFQVEMACDMIQDASLILVQPGAFLPGLAYYPQQPQSVPQVYLVRGNRASQLSDGERFRDFDAQSVPIPDPLSLGTGFCAESTKLVRHSQSLAQLQSWDRPGMNVKLEGPLTIFHNAWQEIPKAYSSGIYFDTSRGGMIREIVHVPDPRKRDLIRGEVEPIKVGEHWLPKRVAYTCSSSGLFYTWTMDWVSVNEPIPADLFDPKTVLVLLGIAK